MTTLYIANATKGTRAFSVFFPGGGGPMHFEVAPNSVTTLAGYADHAVNAAIKELLRTGVPPWSDKVTTPVGHSTSPIVL